VVLSDDPLLNPPPSPIIFLKHLVKCAGAAFITLSGDERKEFLAEVERVTTSWAARGYAPHTSNDTVIVFEKLAPMNAGTGWLTASLGPITLRTTFTIVDVGGSVRVVGDPAMVQWAGTAREAPVAGAFTAPQAAVDDVNAVLSGVRQKFGT